MAVTLPPFVFDALAELDHERQTPDSPHAAVDLRDPQAVAEALEALDRVKAARWVASRPLVLARAHSEGRHRQVSADGVVEDCRHEWDCVRDDRGEPHPAFKDSRRECQVCGTQEDKQVHEHEWTTASGDSSVGHYTMTVCASCGHVKEITR